MDILEKIERKENKNLVVFNSLCDRAKEILFNYLECFGEMQFFWVSELENFVSNLTPIEQIFHIASKIYEINNEKFMVVFDAQKKIDIGDEIYRVDFLVEFVYINGEEVLLERPLVVELDGQEYHKTKEQRERDYKRENDLKLFGFDVMRFTGSQVFNQPMQCIKKIFQYCKKYLKKRGD